MNLSALRGIKNIQYSEVFGILEKSAIVKILLLMCTSDTDFHDDERVFIKELLNLLHITKSQFESINKLSEDRTYQILESMDETKKVHFYRLLKSAVMADGEVSEHELALFKEVCAKTGIVLKPTQSDKD